VDEQGLVAAAAAGDDWWQHASNSAIEQTLHLSLTHINTTWLGQVMPIKRMYSFYK